MARRLCNDTCREDAKIVTNNQKEFKMFTINHGKPLCCGLAFAATLGVSTAHAWADDDFPSHQESAEVSTAPLSLENYCNLKFPAIRGRTRDSDNPQLKSANSGDVVDYYGPCDHDPLGKDEILSQKHDFTRDWETNYGSE
ncbi:MAG: hypothetical protein ACREO5_05640 [Candidatus Binatia bacterium]